MKKLSARRIATTAAVTLGLLGAAAAIPTAAFAGQSAPDASSATAASGNNALLAAINDARLHPEKYAPHGNTAGAKMTGCSTPFRSSAALYRGANDHDKWLAAHPVEWLDGGGDETPNAHSDPSGVMAWADNGHIALAGFKSARYEIVAAQMTTSAAAVRAWMQDDEGSKWGHRNIILNCDLQFAGASHYVGGPGKHYYTADMGNR